MHFQNHSFARLASLTLIHRKRLRFPDLTQYAISAAAIDAKTITSEVANKARMLIRFDRATSRLRAVVKMLNAGAVRTIRSVKGNQWRVPNKLRGEHPLQEEENMLPPVTAAIHSAFEHGEAVEILDGVHDKDVSRSESPGN